MTIFGESAGSWSIFYHLISPASRGLYRRAIAQSGVMDYAPAFPTQDGDFGRENAMAVAAAAGCANDEGENNDAVILECSRKLN